MCRSLPDALSSAVVWLATAIPLPPDAAGPSCLGGGDDGLFASRLVVVRSADLLIPTPTENGVDPDTV